MSYVLVRGVTTASLPTKKSSIVCLARLKDVIKINWIIISIVVYLLFG